MPGNAEYIARFRHRGQELTRLLDDVRRELGREFAAAPSGSLKRGPATASGDGARAEAALDYRDFLLRRQIGTGGICRVYTAVQRGTDRPAAVKILRKQWRDSPHLVQRLLLEAELLGRIHHVGVPELYGTGRLPQGGYFLAILCSPRKLAAERGTRSAAALCRLRAMIVKTTPIPFRRWPARFVRLAGLAFAATFLRSEFFRRPEIRCRTGRTRWCW